jgi:ATP-dependent DNA helicase RecG
MTIEELEALIAQGEGQQLEFKRSLAELETAVRTLAAFANTGGGTVLFGVRQSGEIVGVEASHTSKEQLVNKVTSSTDPVLYPSVEFVKVNGKTVIVVTVAESDNKPHLAGGRAYKRVGTATVQLRRDEYERLLLSRRQPPFDQRELPEATLDDVDEAKVRWYLQRTAQERNIPVDLTLPLVENLKRLGVVIGRDGRPVLTVAATLLFGKRPQSFVSHSLVRLACFHGTTPLHFIDRLDCVGTLPEMIDEAERFVKRNTRIAAKITGFERREITEYPYPAIREGIANAVAHRDYDRADVEVRVSVFADRIEVQSPGRLPAPLTLDTLGEEYALRNKLIAELLFNIRYIERRNTGIMRMRRWMREHGLPEPVFQEVGQTFKVTFQGPGDHILDLIPEEGVTDLRALGLNERQIEALRLMVNEKRVLTNRDYRELFNVGNQTAARELTRLVEKGQARQVGSGRATKYEAS